MLSYNISSGHHSIIDHFLQIDIPNVLPSCNPQATKIPKLDLLLEDLINTTNESYAHIKYTCTCPCFKHIHKLQGREKIGPCLSTLLPQHVSSIVHINYKESLWPCPP